MREFNSETFLNIDEIKERYGWAAGTIYYFRSDGLLESYKFSGDKKSYWKLSELEAIKNRPPEIRKRGPKKFS